MWRPTEDDPGVDGETVEEMEQTAVAEEAERMKNEHQDVRLWEAARRGYFTRRGEYIGPGARRY